MTECSHMTVIQAEDWEVRGVARTVLRQDLVLGCQNSDARYHCPEQVGQRALGLYIWFTVNDKKSRPCSIFLQRTEYLNEIIEKDFQNYFPLSGLMIFYRNGNRRPTTRRRRKKASPFKVISKWNFPIYFISNIETITLWLLFLVFTLSATIFFLLLVYLDLVSNNKNSRELALCCGAFGWVLALLTGREKCIKIFQSIAADGPENLGVSPRRARRRWWIGAGAEADRSGISL